MPYPPDAPRKIRERLDQGLLPREGSKTMFAGHGTKLPCAGCDEPILPSQVEYEFDVDGRIVRFHLGCAGVWEAERRQRGWLSVDRRASAEEKGSSPITP
jgi:hypothetical protein